MKNKEIIVSVLKAAALAFVLCLCSVLAFALVVKYIPLGDGAIKAINQCIKILSVFIGCFFSVKGSAGLIKGGLAGALCTLLIYAVFSMMSGGAFFSSKMLADLLFTAIIGALAGIISVNVKGKE